ncbi:MAG: lysozyme inhibitor LprI family protein [Acidobacteriaceae bacterium]
MSEPIIFVKNLLLLAHPMHFSKIHDRKHVGMEEDLLSSNTRRLIACLSSCALFIFIFTSGTSNSFANETVCANAPTQVAYLGCLSSHLKNEQKNLRAYYENALKQMPKDSSFNDRRKTQSQLKKSQNAWMTYINENCAYIGGLQGGSSLMIDIFEEECLVNSTKSRINFFQHLPTGG